MKKLIRKDKLTRFFFKSFELEKFILSHITKNDNLDISSTWNASIDLSGLPKKSSKVVFVNRCLATGRKNCLNKSFSLSRLAFLRFARANKLFKLEKSKW